MADPMQVAAINALQPGQVEATQMRPATAVRTAAPSKSFHNVLSDAITEVQRLQTEADTTIRNLVSGKTKDVTETMVAVERADVAFQTMMLVRNKIVAAYDEIMRMQV